MSAAEDLEALTELAQQETLARFGVYLYQHLPSVGTFDLSRERSLAPHWRAILQDPEAPFPGWFKVLVPQSLPGYLAAFIAYEEDKKRGLLSPTPVKSQEESPEESLKQSIEYARQEIVRSTMIPVGADAILKTLNGPLQPLLRLPGPVLVFPCWTFGTVLNGLILKGIKDHYYRDLFWQFPAFYSPRRTCRKIQEIGAGSGGDQALDVWVRSQPWVLVEGSADGESFSHVYERVLACLTAQVTEEQARLLVGIGVRSVVICFDRDTAGRTGTERAEKVLNRLRVMTARMEIPPDCAKDPGDVMGLEAPLRLRARQYMALQLRALGVEGPMTGGCDAQA